MTVAVRNMSRSAVETTMGVSGLCFASMAVTSGENRQMAEAKMREKARLTGVYFAHFAAGTGRMLVPHAVRESVQSKNCI